MLPIVKGIGGIPHEEVIGNIHLRRSPLMIDIGVHEGLQWLIDHHTMRRISKGAYTTS